MVYTYTQILEKIKKFKLDSGAQTWCESCGYPCLADYTATGYKFSSGSIYSMLDTCESFKWHLVDKVPGFMKKWVDFEINLRKALYEANIFEQDQASPQLDSFTYSAEEVDDVFNEGNMLALKAVIQGIADPVALTAKITKDVSELLEKKVVTTDPNLNVESTIEFYTSKFKKTTTDLKDPFVFDLMRKASSRFVHLFIKGKSRFNMKNCEVNQISLNLEFNDYFKINFNTDTKATEPTTYKLLTLDGVGTKEQHIKNIKAGRNKFIVFDALFATGILDSNNNIYFKFDNSTKDYLVKIKDVFFETHRHWVILKSEPINLNTCKTVGFRDVVLNSKDVVKEQIVNTKYLYLDLAEYRDLGNDTTNVSFAIYSVPSKGFEIGTNRSEPKMRFMLSK